MKHDGSRLPGLITGSAPGGYDDWWTPTWLFDALGMTFYCDPASSAAAAETVPAAHFHDEAENGLLVPWHGLVWLNPPYSSPGPWVSRLASHGDGVALLPVDTSTVWWQDTVASAAAVCFVRGRIRFHGPDGQQHPARFASALVAWGDRSARAVAACNLGWTVQKGP